MLGLVRALVVGGFVHHQVRLFTIWPRFTFYREIQIGGVKVSGRVIAQFPIHRDFTIDDQDAAKLAGAKALGMQDTFEG